jgi:hypothetical protein
MNEKYKSNVSVVQSIAEVECFFDDSSSTQQTPVYAER